jgi:hypothetical protein
MKIVAVMVSILFFCITGPTVYASEKSLIGETAWIGVRGIPFTYLSRIDTGARVTSIHAVDIEVINGSETADENIGKTISFTTVNRAGKSKTVTATITRVGTVKNSQGTEKRYVIMLPLSWKQIEKKVEVNLRDRSRMTYKLLIGRNWLSHDFLVDVDIKADEIGEK